MRRLCDHPYRGRWAAIATMHGKERAVAPVLCRWFDMAVTTAPGVDTDAFGTFTGEVARQGTILDAARAKAQLAIERTGAAIGIGSEGAFGPDPELPFVATGRELLLLREAATGHEIVVTSRTRTNFNHMNVSPNDLVDECLVRIGFPDHAAVVRAFDGSYVAKGLTTRDQVDAALHALFEAGQKGILQADMRAHLNPTRMASIARLARTLAVRLARCCPACGSPGFGLVDVERGLPCRECRFPTRRIRAEIYGCSACGEKRKRHDRPDSFGADPMWCQVCNP